MHMARRSLLLAFTLEEVLSNPQPGSAFVSLLHIQLLIIMRFDFDSALFIIYTYTVCSVVC